MPPTELECPRCGAAVQFGLPRNATVESVTAEDVDPETTDDRKTRKLACPEDHVFAVTFVY